MLVCNCLSCDRRYPIFTDAVRDIDDALCIIFLFASLPSNGRISSSLVENCSRLAAEWQLYVMRTHSLQKVFLSIKGVYYQAEVMDQPVTWLVPYQFTQNVSLSNILIHPTGNLGYRYLRMSTFE
jgi:pescadillo